ncbi:unnamed protein product [Ambrosiozyma monospora]|uniref:Unnamed protein product n=1 Tax=Ambrosiozyma monospora TaxID=43982 RepID=A0ACB5U4R0_AMBMO|nr:unnamed protein product [Ambrosiozyma monospora]
MLLNGLSAGFCLPKGLPAGLPMLKGLSEGLLVPKGLAVEDFLPPNNGPPLKDELENLAAKSSSTSVDLSLEGGPAVVGLANEKAEPVF